MTEVIRTYRQSIPAIRFIGKKYSDEERIDGSFGPYWGEWFSKGWFGELEKNVDMKAGYEDGDAYIGLMRWKDGEPFEYWIGLFAPAGTAVPDGYLSVDFEDADLGVAWLYGKENEVYGQEGKCAASCQNAGYKIIPDSQGAYWFFERYARPRSTTQDDKGNIILDICHFIEKK